MYTTTKNYKPKKKNNVTSLDFKGVGSSHSKGNSIITPYVPCMKKGPKRIFLSCFTCMPPKLSFLLCILNLQSSILSKLKYFV